MTVLRQTKIQDSTDEAAVAKVNTREDALRTTDMFLEKTLVELLVEVRRLNVQLELITDNHILDADVQ